jgi:CheY-like chemotaxis protein
MRILFLDDMETRHDAAVQWFSNRPGVELVQVRTAPEAIARLSENHFDVVFLDHDLAEEHYLTLSEGLSEDRAEGEAEYMCGTGMDVVDWLVANPIIPGDGVTPARHSNIIVHSWNPSRAPEMHYRLKQAGYNAYRIPFNPCNCPVITMMGGK